MDHRELESIVEYLKQKDQLTPLESDFIEADGFERGGARTDAAEVETFHALNNAADCGEVVEILFKSVGQRMNDVGLHDGEGNLVLIENIGDREFSAVCVAAVIEVHLADFVGVCLHEYRHACVLKCGNRAVFVDEYGHTEYYTIVFTLVGLEPVVVNPAFVTGFDSSVACGVFVHDEIFVARIGHGLDHVIACSGDKLCRHESAVSEVKCKFHNCDPFVFIIADFVFAVKICGEFFAINAEAYGGPK